MKILLTGDRKWSDTGLINEILDLYKPDQTIIAVKSDPIAPLIMKCANEKGFVVETCNEDYTGIDYVVVFHKYIRGSVQCKVLLKETSRLNIPYQIVGSSF